MKTIYTLKQIEALPTIKQGHTDDLKIETKDMRIWLSRLTKEDGIAFDNQVTIEKLYRATASSRKSSSFGTRWMTYKEYEAK